MISHFWKIECRKPQRSNSMEKMSLKFDCIQIGNGKTLWVINYKKYEYIQTWNFTTMHRELIQIRVYRWYSPCMAHMHLSFIFFRSNWFWQFGLKISSLPSTYKNIHKICQYQICACSTKCLLTIELKSLDTLNPIIDLGWCLLWVLKLLKLDVQLNCHIHLHCLSDT